MYYPSMLILNNFCVKSTACYDQIQCQGCCSIPPQTSLHCNSSRGMSVAGWIAYPFCDISNRYVMIVQSDCCLVTADTNMNMLRYVETEVLVVGEKNSCML